MIPQRLQPYELEEPLGAVPLVTLDRCGEERPQGQLAHRNDHVLEDGHPPEKTGDLERPHPPQMNDVAGAFSDDRDAPNVDLAPLRTVEAGHAVEERRLAGAIRPDQ